ncbi:MAG TPA: hypothetical protein VF865_13570 [Acidobacteriaceae bacterium]
MANCFDYTTTYFWREGKPNLHDCLRISFEAAKRHGIGKIVIFTGVGEGVRAAVHDFLSQEDYADIRLVAVTFPHGHKHDIPDTDSEWIASNNIPLIRAHLPFDPIKAQFAGHGVLGQDFSLLGNVLNIFGGSMSLCVQAVLMACDAGVIRKGEHVISLTSDTSILVRAAPTSHLLTDFIVREIFCKSAFMDISKRETAIEAGAATSAEEITATGSPKLIEG